VGHGQFFLRRHAAAGRLLAIAQSGVEEGNVIGVICHMSRLPGEDVASISSFADHPDIRQSYSFWVSD